MMKNKITIAFLTAVAVSLNLAAKEMVCFSDFINADGSGIDKLKTHYKFFYDKKKVVTTHDSVNEAHDYLQLITVLLNETVMKKVRKLPVSKGMVVLRSHQLWWKYFDSTPSLPEISGSARGIISLMQDFSRISARWEALKLPYEQYLIYAKIANLSQVPLDCGTYKMRFGEICLKKEACWAKDPDTVKTFGKYYHLFPIRILPESCRKTSKRYIAVLSASEKSYLCIWDLDGMPLAVHLLEGSKKIISISLAKENRVEIVYESDNKKQLAEFAIDKANQNKIAVTDE